MQTHYWVLLTVFFFFIIETPAFSKSEKPFDKSFKNLLKAEVTLSYDDAYSKELGLLHLKNREWRGKDYERPGFFKLHSSDGEQEILDISVGVRLHGGSSRKAKDPSFRVYFNSKKIKIPNQVEKNLSEMLKSSSRLVVHRANDVVNLVAFDVAEKLGAKVPRVQPVELTLNILGAPAVDNEPYAKQVDKNQNLFAKQLHMGLYFLSDHLKLKEWLSIQKRNGVRGKKDKGKKVYFHKFKNVVSLEKEQAIKNFTVSDEELLQMDDGKELLSARKIFQLKRIFLDAEAVDLKFANQHINVDNLIKHLLPIVITGTTDWRQGIAIQELDKKDKRWHFINWDMEHSFYDYNHINYRRKKGFKKRPAWRQEGFELVMASGVKWWKQGLEEQRPFRKWDVRALIFYRLWVEDPEFRSLLRKELQNAQALLSKNWVKKTSDYYYRLVQKIEDDAFIRSNLPGFEAFFKCRFLFLGAQLETLEVFIEEQVDKTTFQGEEHVPSDYNGVWLRSQNFECSQQLNSK